MRSPNLIIMLALFGFLALSACGVDAAEQAELDAQLLRRLTQAEAEASRSAAARQFLITIQRERSTARFKSRQATERLGRRGGSILTRFSGGRGNFMAAQAEQRMAQTHEARARAAEAKLREFIVQSARKTLGAADYERAVALRRRPKVKNGQGTAKPPAKRTQRPTSRPTPR